jgi:hypothetical protein
MIPAQYDHIRGYSGFSGYVHNEFMVIGGPHTGIAAELIYLIGGRFN